MLAFQAKETTATKPYVNCARRRTAFTLFELILAIALSGVLLALIGAAINLYLMRVDASRDRVEEAQLARSILSMIADDLRATAIYQPQDVSSVQQLMSESASFDVDSIDEERDDSSPSLGGTSSPGGAGTAGTVGGAGSSSGLGGNSGSGSGGGGATTQIADSDMPLGLNGTLAEMYVDVARLPTGDELFNTLTGYTNAPMAMQTNNAMAATMGMMWGSTPSPSDLKTIRYFVRDGDRTNLTGMAATSLAPELQMRAGGLVRQVIPRPARIYAEQTGDTAILQGGQVLVAPEVMNIEFRYFDGQQIVDTWDMAEEPSLPVAIEVTIWLTSVKEASENVSSIDPAALLRTARQYRQTVFLPMAELSRMAGPMSTVGGSSTSSTSSSSTSSFGSSSGSSTTGSGTSSGQP
jgi:uncharacterized membrane protein YgcG